MKNKKKQERIKSYEELTEILAGCVNIPKLDRVWKDNIESIKSLPVSDLHNLLLQRNVMESGGLVPPMVIAAHFSTIMLKSGCQFNSPRFSEILQYPYY